MKIDTHILYARNNHLDYNEIKFYNYFKRLKSILKTKIIIIDTDIYVSLNNRYEYSESVTIDIQGIDLIPERPWNPTVNVPGRYHLMTSQMQYKY